MPPTSDPVKYVHGMCAPLQALLAAATCLCPDGSPLPALRAVGLQWPAGVLANACHLLGAACGAHHALLLFRYVLNVLDSELRFHDLMGCTYGCCQCECSERLHRNTMTRGSVGVSGLLLQLQIMPSQSTSDH